jgi:hypothetical protein
MRQEGEPAMASVTDLLTTTLQGDTVRRIGAQIGADEQTTASAIQLALPTLLGALARNASSEQGASALAGALARDHDGSILDDLTGMLGSGGPSSGASILGHVFGDRRGAVQDTIAQSTGLDGDASGKLLALIAPLVLGALSRSAQQRSGSVSAESLTDLLSGERASLQQHAPDVMGMLGSLLDADKDGSVVDDLGRMATRFFTAGGR